LESNSALRQEKQFIGIVIGEKGGFFFLRVTEAIGQVVVEFNCSAAPHCVDFQHCLRWRHKPGAVQLF